MKTLKTILLAAAVVAPGLLTATGVSAQTVAVADPQVAVSNTKAFQAAIAQIRTTYKPQIDQAEARRAAITAELQPLVTKLQNDQKANVAQATLQSEYQTIQNRQQSAQQELARITLPAERAQAYAAEQIAMKLSDAVQAAVRARNISLVVKPEAVLLLGQPAADITPAITTELDRLVPSVSTAVPANWQPGQQGQGSGAASTAAPAPRSGRKPSGR